MNWTPPPSKIIAKIQNKCPPGFTPIVKTYNDGSDADLWKDGFGFGIFNRVVRYLAIGRNVSDPQGLEVITDLAIISEKEAVPSNFVCIDFTADTKEKALKKKFLSGSKKPPKGYTSAGDIDGMLICYKVTTIPQTYGQLKHSQSTEIRPPAKGNMPLYPNINDPTLPIASQNNAVKGVDGVPFQLNPVFSKSLLKHKISNFLDIPELKIKKTTLTTLV
uniref:MABP domain-containing protein n=1 Tax=Ditylenchus dipsaci TaxID=166011 RepID=A0A915D4Y0_9BILA